MKRLRELNGYRRKGGLHEAGDFGGAFQLPYPSKPGVILNCIATNGGGWDHVSVSLNMPRTPSWAEMEFVKRAFFREDEVAMQLHVAVANHISIHPYVLHLWRPHEGTIPLPPVEFV